MKWVAICSIVRLGVCMNEKRPYFSIIKAPNVRAKQATTAGRQGPVGENVPRDRALVACRWRSA